MQNFKIYSNFLRYIHIIYHNKYEKMFTRNKTILYCLICWMIGVLIDLPNFLGWGGFYYDTKSFTCVWNRLASESYSIFFPMSSIVIPCCCIFFFYLRIFFFASSNIGKIKTSGDSQNKSLRIAKGLFASFLLFTICW